mgnify:CR=1 FL=1
MWCLEWDWILTIECKGICHRDQVPFKRYTHAKKCTTCRWWRPRELTYCQCCGQILRGVSRNYRINANPKRILQ